jgi:hypothetical protein
MITTLTTLIDRLDRGEVASEVLDWGCPVPVFGNLSSSKVATVGINPSNREFMDADGRELNGDFRRFPTLTSLELGAWAHAHATHFETIIESYKEYFSRNPYNAWFQRLDYVIGKVGTSYYSKKDTACHLDLFPYATACKWTQLGHRQRANLLRVAGNTFGELLHESELNLLVLNGRTVIQGFQELTGVQLEIQEVSDWDLNRSSMNPVKGLAFLGQLDEISGRSLGRTVKILGFNHNLQSSFGVTKQVMTSIRGWIGSQGLQGIS